MKSRFLAIIFIAAALFSCSKETVSDSNQKRTEEDGCIERSVVPVSAHSVPPAAISVINNLFLNNHIDKSKYRYYQYEQQALQTYFPPYEIIDEKIVRVDEYTNGLRIFTGQLVFDFQNNLINFKGGAPTSGTTLNTTPRLTLKPLRKMFIDNIDQFDYRGDFYKDSCFKAEFGYFNLNAGTGISTEKLVKAWRVTLKNLTYPSEYPIAYYQDDDGKLIYYDNGIRTFK